MRSLYSYYIYLLTFLVFPILILILYKYVDISKSKKYLKYPFLFFIVHNVLFYFDYSIKDDYPDYVIFSLEYLYFCLIIAILYKSKNIFSEIFRIIGTIIITIGFLQGIMGILFFILGAMDYDANKIYEYKFDGNTYEVRRYCAGFVTWSSTRYTYETYKHIKFTPFEKKIDKTIFLDTESNLNFEDDSLKIEIINKDEKQQIQFTSSDGNKFIKTIN